MGWCCCWGCCCRLQGWRCGSCSGGHVALGNPALAEWRCARYGPRRPEALVIAFSSLLCKPWCGMPSALLLCRLVYSFTATCLFCGSAVSAALQAHMDELGLIHPPDRFGKVSAPDTGMLVLAHRPLESAQAPARVTRIVAAGTQAPRLGHCLCVSYSCPVLVSLPPHLSERDKLHLQQSPGQ